MGKQARERGGGQVGHLGVVGRLCRPRAHLQVCWLSPSRRPHPVLGNLLALHGADTLSLKTRICGKAGSLGRMAKK